jgi:hypothetical protein
MSSLGHGVAPHVRSEVPVAPESTEDYQVTLIERALIEKYAGRVSTAAIHDEVTSVALGLQGARIRTYVPVLIKREAEDRVRPLTA